MITKSKGWYILLVLMAIMLTISCAPTTSSISPSVTVTSRPVSSQTETTNPATLPPSTMPGPTIAPPPVISKTPAALPPVKTLSPTIFEADALLPPPGFIVDYNRTNLNRSVRAFGGAYRGRIIDTHTHLDAVTNRDSVDMQLLATVIKAMSQENVDSITIMPVPNQQLLKNRELIAEQYEKILEMGGGKIKLFLESGFISSWLNESYNSGEYDIKKLNGILNGLNDDIANPDCSGIGEMGLYHFNKTGFQPVIAYSPTFAPFLNVISTIADAGMWLDLHAEPVDPDGVSYEDQVFGGLALLYQLFPDLKLVYSHTAMTNPTNARRILETYPNVIMNFKPVTDHDDWRNLEPVCDTQGHLYEDWAKLFEEMPERFMVGTDMKFGLHNGNDIAAYQKEINLVRNILGSIDPEAAELIAYKNAERIYQ